MFGSKAFAAAGLAAGSYATYVGATWLRYGRPTRATGDAVDHLLDRYMPSYEVGDRHHVRVAAPPAATLAAATTLELDRSRTIRAIFRARELILRSEPDATVRPAGLLAQMRSIGWGVLAEDPGHEIVLGAATRPWDANPEFRPLPPDEFAAFCEPGYVKIAWTLRAEPAADGGTTFWTETRAVATDPVARARFRWYWAFLSPGIILIRRALLAGLASAADRAWQVEGDDLLPTARTVLTHAVQIAAPPRDVWPWLLQMGCQRGGWYSWDVLDNAGVRSATQIIPALQHLELGDVLPARPIGPDGFEVVRIVPERALVLGSKTSWFDGTWAFVLEPVGPDGAATRLVTRYRAAYEPSAKMTAAVPVIAAVHAVMEKKQLRTIKRHAEHLHA